MSPADAAVAIDKASVLVVDDHGLFRTGVANIINQEPDLRVVAEASNGLQAIDAFDRHRPDVTRLDLRMPVMEGVEAVRRIRDLDPNARLIILTPYDTDDEISRALKAGAKAYVLKDISADACGKFSAPASTTSRASSSRTAAPGTGRSSAPTSGITIRASSIQSVGLRVSVADDGRGIINAPSPSGFGLTSMQERADKIGASLTIVTAPRSGTEVVLAWEPASLPTQVHYAV